MEKKLKIAVNTRFLLKGKLEGIGLFTYESVKRMVQAHPEVDFYFLFDRPFDPEFIFGSNVTPVVLFPPARHPLLWYWWFNISVARWLRHHRPHVLLSPDGYACLPTDVPQVVVIHDLAFEHFRAHTPWLTYRYYKHFVPLFARKAKRLATVSAFSKSDIIQHYGISAEKIDVVYNGAKEVYRPVDESVKEQVRQRLTAGKEFFIYVGAVHPRKNIRNLLLAFEQFKAETGSDFKLLLVGRMAWDYSDVNETYNRMRFSEEVIFAGHVPPEELGPITASAVAMVYVSLFEGFGIPIVEAMSSDVPVITSGVTSMPEAAGEAALLVDPTVVDDIATAMKRIAGEPELRTTLIAKGREQVKKFSWELTAGKLWDTCIKALKE